MENIFAIIGTIGGVQGIIELVKWWRGRKVNDRRDVAAVVAAENDNYRRQIDWYEQRLKERDQKVDSLYMELRTEQNAHLKTIQKLHELELKFAEAEVRKCHKRGCPDRIPPSDY